MTPPILSPDTLEALKQLREECPMPWHIFTLTENCVHIECASGGTIFYRRPPSPTELRIAQLLSVISQDPNLQN